ncbi:MAG: DUF3971 domain-containing protein [Gammaproteobacteria bacterium]|nr:DUF3971 domain-containing protein [Gammaproteobacteria bacterium]
MAAVVFSLFRAAVPHITDYGDTIEEQLSRYLAMPVKIGQVEADIAWLVPRLRLIDVSFHDEINNRQLMHLDEIDLSLDWIKTIEYLRPELGVVSLVGAELQVEYNQQGNLVIQGFEVNADQGSAAAIPIEINQLLSSISIYIVDATIHWRDLRHNGQRLDLTKVNMALINDSPGHTLSIKTALPADYGKHLEMIIDIKGELTEPLSWHGRTYVNIDDLQIQKWFDDYWQLLGFAGAGQMNAQFWIEWDKQQINQINAKLNGQQLKFAYLDENVRSWQLDQLSGDYRWKRNPSGWQLDARDVEIKRDEREWPFPAAATVWMDEQKNQLDIKANFARLEGLAYVAGFAASFFPTTEFDWDETIEPYAPAGDLYDLNLIIPLEQPNNIEINTRFVDLSYTSASYVPSVKGLDGRLSYEDKSTRLKIASQHVDLDFNGLFRKPMHLNVISGEMLIYRQADSWHLDAEKITALAPHLTTQTRINVSIPDDKPVFINLISQYKQGNAAFTSNYLPTAIMSEELVNWLDNAIVKGDITQGGYLLYGNMNDFPFNNNEGVMEALFNVENMRMQYMPDWPALDDLQARVCFHGKSMDITDAKGSLYAGQFENTQVKITDLSQPRLDLKGDVSAPLSDMLKFVENSPLKEDLGSFLLSFQAQGDADLALEFKLPLDSDDEMQLAGALNFKGNEVYLSEQDYLLKGLTGQLSFTEQSVEAENLQASLDGFPLSIKVVTPKNNTKRLTQVGVAGYAPVKSLLAPVPELREYLGGGSEWDVAINVLSNDGNQAPQVDILLSSNLQGVESSLPGPLAKSKDGEIPLKLHIGLQEKNDLILDVIYGDNNTLTAVRKKEFWDVSMSATSLSGKVKFAEDFQRDETIKLDVEYIDLALFTGSNKKIEQSDLLPQQIPSLDINIKKLDFKDWKLHDISLKTRRSRSGMIVDHLALHAPFSTVTGKGTWFTGWRNKHTTALELDFTSENLGESLHQLNISQGIKKTEGSVQARWQWHAEPYNFSWQLLKGDANMSFEDGQLSDIDPGAGRLLGIFNFETLLSLDLGNQVAKGFAFDDMQGSFSFSDGNAYTDDFSIKSKVAKISMQGRLGLSREDYDQTITVIPGVGSTLTVIGAVTGGPVTAAAVHLFQKIFGIDHIAKYKYKVTGSWDEPEVKLLSAPEPEETTPDDEDDF